MKIGIDSYCYHRYFGEVYPFQADPGRRWTTDDFLNRAQSLGVDGVSLESCFLTRDLDELKALGERLRQQNLEYVLAWGHPDGLEGGRNLVALQDLVKSVHLARLMGAKVMRIVGSSLRFKDEAHQPQLARLAEILREAAHIAEDNDVTLALENHIDFTASEILGLIEKVNSRNFGVNFDTGNALRLFEDPVEAARLLAPHIYATHIKDVSPRRGGSPREWNFWESVPAGHGVVDIPGVLRVLHDGGYQGLLCVETDCLRNDWEEDQAVELSVQYLRDQVRHVQGAGESQAAAAQS
ncbi:MAG: sugar phosphate isomerase/epimerase family protein [Acidobacteriota bacterium]